MLTRMNLIKISFRFDKVAIQTNATSRAYVTDTWIIKIGMYNVYFAHQTDAMLIVNNVSVLEFIIRIVVVR